MPLTQCCSVRKYIHLYVMSVSDMCTWVPACLEHIKEGIHHHTDIFSTHSYSPASSRHITWRQVAVRTEGRLPSRFCRRPGPHFICLFNKLLDAFMCSDVQVRWDQLTCFCWNKHISFPNSLIQKQASRAHSWQDICVFGGCKGDDVHDVHFFNPYW